MVHFQPPIFHQHRRHLEGPTRRVRREHDGRAAEARGDQHHRDPHPSGLQQLDPGARHRAAQAGEAGQTKAGIELEHQLFLVIVQLYRKEVIIGHLADLIGQSPAQSKNI